MNKVTDGQNILSNISKNTPGTKQFFSSQSVWKKELERNLQQQASKKEKNGDTATLAHTEKPAPKNISLLQTASELTSIAKNQYAHIEDSQISTLKTQAKAYRLSQKSQLSHPEALPIYQTGINHTDKSTIQPTVKSLDNTTLANKPIQRLASAETKAFDIKLLPNGELVIRNNLQHELTGAKLKEWVSHINSSLDEKIQRVRINGHTAWEINYQANSDIIDDIYIIDSVY